MPVLNVQFDSVSLGAQQAARLTMTITISTKKVRPTPNPMASSRSLLGLLDSFVAVVVEFEFELATAAEEVGAAV